TAPCDAAFDARRRHLCDAHPVLDEARLDNHDELTRAHAQRPDQVRRILADERRRAVSHLVAVHEEARHGFMVRYPAGTMAPWCKSCGREPRTERPSPCRCTATDPRSFSSRGWARPESS